MANPTFANYNGTPLVPAPPNLPVPPQDYSSDFENHIFNALRLYFNQLNNFAQATQVPSTGTTLQRPKTALQIGRFYFDQTLGYPIWWNGSKWVNSSGTVV
jgi:hypothetical protein